MQGNKSFFIFLICGLLLCLTKQGNCQKEARKLKIPFKQTVLLSGDFVNASLETNISFSSKNSLLIANIGLENNLGLEKSKLFFAGTVLWRITKRSGIFATYYRLHRRKTYTVKRDIPYLDKYIPQGTEVDAYFNTNVLSLGYMFTIVSDKKSYLGGYFNIYLMNLKTGVDSQGITLHENLSFLAPLPNFGLLAMFKVNSWLGLNGKFGMFYLRMDDFSGKINDASVSASFNVYRWIYLNLSYKIFDISVVTYTRDIKTTVDYNFRGPGLGVTLKF